MYFLLNFKAFGGDINVEQWSHNCPCMGAGFARLFVSHRLFIAHEIWLLMVVGQNPEVGERIQAATWEVCQFYHFQLPSFCVPAWIASLNYSFFWLFLFSLNFKCIWMIMHVRTILWGVNSWMNYEVLEQLRFGEVCEQFWWGSWVI